MGDPAYPDALAPQYRLHWYLLERVLGQGGFGITYLARDTNLDQPVAIKEYLPVEVATRRADATVRARTDDQSDRYRWGLDRFIREARTLARFDHPNIVRVHSVFEFNNTAYMVMRFEEGENFAALLERRRTMPEADLMRVLLPVLDGLELVHNAGFIHRDIKPDNLHIRADGSPVLLDFGSARTALGQARTVTILVAPGYAPFEQYYSSGEDQGPWTDLYGLAATCYRAIAGIPPMDAIARSKGILGSTREILVPASAIGSGRYSARLLKAIDHALEFAEKDRPQTIAEWRAELAGNGVPAHAAPASAAIEVAPTVRAPSPPTADRAGPGRRSSTKGPIVWAAAGAVVAAIAVGLWLRPAADGTRLDELERRLEQQRQRDDDARKQSEQERVRLAKEQQQRDQERERLAKAQQQQDQERKRDEEQKYAEQEHQRLVKEKQKGGPERKLAAAPRAQKPTPVTEPSTAQPAPSAPPVTSAPSAVTASPPTAAVAPPAAAPAPPPEATSAPRKAPVQAVPKDEAEAFAFYRKLGLQGDSEAQIKVGDLYASGRGVPQNNNQAYFWYGLAVRSGNAAAKIKKEQVAAKLQPAEIRQADILIDRQRRPAQ